MIISKLEIFPFQNALIIAFLGALIGQLIIIAINFIKREIDLNRKKDMIINDLKSQLKVLNLVSEKYLELKNMLERRETDSFTTNVFHTLQLDIYQSVPKNELYAIFKKRLFLLVDIYKSIEFIKLHTPYLVYSDYLKKSELHFEEKKDDPNHINFCDTELGFIDMTIKNIDNHLKTIFHIKLDIEKLIGKKTV